MENDMKQIAQGAKLKTDALRDCIQNMLEIFHQTVNKRDRIVSLFSQLMSEQFVGLPQIRGPPETQNN